MILDKYLEAIVLIVTPNWHSKYFLNKSRTKHETFLIYANFISFFRGQYTFTAGVQFMQISSIIYDDIHRNSLKLSLEAEVEIGWV